MRLLLFVLLAVAARADQEPFARISQIKPEVNVQSQPAVVGALKAGDHIEVAAGGSCRIDFFDGSSATLTGHEGEGAELTLPAERPSAAVHVFKLVKGAFAIQVAPGNPSHWQVETENCTASVEGTVFAVAVDPKSKTTRVVVAEGTVKVTAKAGEVLVGKGKETAIAPDKAPSPPAEYDPRDGLGAMAEDQQNIKSGRDVERK